MWVLVLAEEAQKQVIKILQICSHFQVRKLKQSHAGGSGAWPIGFNQNCFQCFIVLRF